MAAIYQEEHSDAENGESGRSNIKSAIAKAAELRALHAALMKGKTPADRSLPSASPVSRRLSAQDYPVFTPSYEDEPITGYQQILSENRSNHSRSWVDYASDVGNNIQETVSSGCVTEANASSRKGFLQCDQNSCPNDISVGRPPRRNSLGDIKSASSAIVIKDSDSLSKNSRKPNIIVPSTDSHSSLSSQSRNKGISLSSLFPRLKMKSKNAEILSMETLKKELIEALESRNAALTEAAEMKSSLGELRQKLGHLETYCEELKKALKQAVRIKNSSAEKSIPVSEEVMVEGFLKIVSESRISVKQFCKTILAQVGENDNLNSLLQPHKLSLRSKNSKLILYHLVAIVNQSLHQDFENCVFRKNGTPNLLDPHQERQSRNKLFAALRNLSWNEVLRKGTKYYSEEFSKFCDQKMSGIVASLCWNKPWPENLLQAFFVAAKCVWLLHLLAFSFDPPLGILRVDENRALDARFMEDMFEEKQRRHGSSRVKIMVMPGFYVHDQVLKCKVLCRYKSVV